MSEHRSVTRKFMLPPRRTKWNLERSYTALTTSQSKGITKSLGLNKRSTTLSQEFRTVCSNWLPRHQEPINLRLLPIRPHVIKRVTLVKDRRSINIIKSVLWEKLVFSVRVKSTVFIDINKILNWQLKNYTQNLFFCRAPWRESAKTHAHKVGKSKWLISLDWVLMNKRVSVYCLTESRNLASFRTNC